MDPGPVHKRRRPAIACTECRRRKTACDLGKPCGPCARSNAKLQCIYNNTHRGSSKGNHSVSNIEHEAQHGAVQGTPRSQTRSTWPQQQTRTHHRRSESRALSTEAPAPQLPDFFDQPVRHLEMLADGNAFTGNEIYVGTQQDFGSYGGSTSIPDEAVFFPNFQHLPQGSSTASIQLEATVANPGDSNASSSLSSCSDLDIPEIQGEDVKFLLRNFASHSYHIRDDWWAFPEHSTAVSFTRTLSKLEQVAQQQQQQQQQSDMIGMLSWPSIGGGSTAKTARDMLPPRPACDALIDTYVRFFETVFSILDLPRFLEDFERFWACSADKFTEDDDALTWKILLVTSIGSNLYPTGYSPDASPLFEQSDRWAPHAECWARSKLIAGETHLYTDVAQVMCLLALRDDTRNSRDRLSSSTMVHVTSDLTRIGMKMGFHRESLLRLSGLSNQEIEVRRRLWATMLELSLHLSFDECLPGPISAETYDCDLLAVPPDGRISCLGELDPLPSTSIIVCLAKTQRLRLRILHMMNAPGALPSYEESNSITSDLNQVCIDSVQLIRSAAAIASDTSADVATTNYQVKMLDILTRPFMLALHGRYADKVSTAPEFYFSRCVRMQCATQLLTHAMERRVPLLAGFPASHQLQQQQLLEQSSLCLAQSSTSTTVASTNNKDHSAALGAYAFTCLRSHNHVFHVQRQATAALFVDLISELENDVFPTLHASSNQEIRGLLESAVDGFECHMRASHGTSSTCEYVLFSSAAAYVDALMRKRGDERGAGGGVTRADDEFTLVQQCDANDAVTAAAFASFNACTGVVMLSEDLRV